MVGNKLLKIYAVIATCLLLMAMISGLTPVIPIRTQTTTDINTSSSGNTLLVSHVTGNVIRFSYHLMANGTTNVSFVYGTQSSTPCDTGTTTIDGPYSLIAQTGMTGVDMVVPAGKDLCIDNSASIQVGGAVSWMDYYE
jgi:hypothetical protein